MHRRLGVIRLLINKTSSLSIFSLVCLATRRGGRGWEEGGPRVCRLHHGRPRDAHCWSFRDSARGPFPRLNWIFPLTSAGAFLREISSACSGALRASRVSPSFALPFPFSSRVARFYFSYERAESLPPFFLSLSLSSSALSFRLFFFPQALDRRFSRPLRSRMRN